nr:Gag-Pol polyprotein [Tanacetum cinerariifolium]
MKEKGDECIFVGYSNQSRAYRVFNKRTRVIMESIHVNFDELPQMASDQNSFDPAPKCQTVALEHDKLNAENDQVADDEFINIFSTPVQDQGRRCHVMLNRQICTLSINDILLNIVGQKIPVSRLEAVRLFIAYAAHKS